LEMILKLVAMIVKGAQINDSCRKELGRYKFNISAFGVRDPDPSAVASILARHGYGGRPEDQIDNIKPADVIKEPDKPDATDSDNAEGTDKPDDPTMKPGDRVIALFNSQDREGEFLEACGGSESGKVRVKLDDDPDKEYREILTDRVKLKG